MWDEAEQARLHIDASLSVSIVRDYAAATQVTPRDLMQRYLEEIVPRYQGADVETNRLRRMMRDEAIVDKKLSGADDGRSARLHLRPADRSGASHRGPRHRHDFPCAPLRRRRLEDRRLGQSPQGAEAPEVFQ